MDPTQYDLRLIDMLKDVIVTMGDELLNWDPVFRLIVRHFKSIRKPEHLKSLSRFFQHTLLTRKCYNYEVYQRIVWFHVLYLWYFGVGQVTDKVTASKMSYMKLGEFEKTKNILCPDSLIPSEMLMSDEEKLNYAFRRADSMYMAVLLKNRDLSSAVETRDGCLLEVWSDINLSVFLLCEFSQYFLLKYKSIQNALCDSWFNQGDPHEFSFLKGHRRILLVLRALQAVLIIQRKSRLVLPYCSETDVERCLRWYFNSLPDPFVTTEEVREFLYSLSYDLRKHRTALDEMVDCYTKLFPYSALPYSPRSLTHLCRCSVRNILGKREKVLLPVLVDQLSVPEDVKYLLYGASEFLSSTELAQDSPVSTEKLTL